MTDPISVVLLAGVRRRRNLMYELFHLLVDGNAYSIDGDCFCTKCIRMCPCACCEDLNDH